MGGQHLSSIFTPVQLQAVDNHWKKRVCVAESLLFQTSQITLLLLWASYCLPSYFVSCRYWITVMSYNTQHACKKKQQTLEETDDIIWKFAKKQCEQSLHHADLELTPTTGVRPAVNKSQWALASISGDCLICQEVKFPVHTCHMWIWTSKSNWLFVWQTSLICFSWALWPGIINLKPQKFWQWHLRSSFQLAAVCFGWGFLINSGRMGLATSNASVSILSNHQIAVTQMR